MSQERYINCGRCRCEGKCQCIPRAQDQRCELPATATSNQAPAPLEASRKKIQRNIGSSGSTASYPTSSQSTNSRPQVKAGKKRGSDASGSSGSALQRGQLGDSRKKRATTEWLGQNRGVPYENLQNSFQQRNVNAPATSTAADPPKKLICPYCPKVNFKDNSKLQDHLKSHFKVRSEMCPNCRITYIYKRDLNKHLKKCNMPRDRDGNNATEVAIPQGLQPSPHYQPQKTYPHTPQSGSPSSDKVHSASAMNEDVDPALFQLSTRNSPNLDAKTSVLQAFNPTRHLPLQDVISVATQVQQQLEDSCKALVSSRFGHEVPSNFEEVWTYYFRREVPGTFEEMLGDGSEFESYDYSTTSGETQGGDKGT